MGLLLLPSLEAKRHIRMEDISQTEAELFIRNLEERVKASRSLNTPSAQTPDAFLTYNLLSDLSDFDIEDIAAELKVSDVPRHRGIRAVFIDETTDTILVGTTVVYSDKWAIVGFDDVEIAETILDFEV